MYISSGAVHRGYLDLESSVRVSAYTGAIIDFTLSNRKSSDEYLINNFALIAGTPTYTITVSADQAFGTYKLAQGAENFTNTISIGNGMITYGSITVNGTKLQYNGTDYTLTQTNGDLLLNVQETIVPTVFIYSNGTLTSSGTTITGARVSGAYNSMHISNCGVANSTTVFDSGCVLVFSGGTANNTTIYSNCTMTLSSGGLANSTTVNSQGRLYISSGGLANYTMITGDLWYGLGSMTVLKGGMAKNTTVGGFMFISSGGTADSTTVISGGVMCISSGGTADSTTVISGGSMHISSGGTATNIIASNGARLWITVASNTYIQGTANGSAFEMKNAQISGYGINSWGTLEVYSGGTADSTTVNSGGVLIYNGGVASNTTVNSGGYIILSGGIHRGTLQIASGATVSAHIYAGGTIDFTVSDRTTEDGYLINDLSLISGAPTYTITVSADQAFGTYKLAQGAENFTNTISIGNGMITYGSITVNGDDLVYDDITYSLDQVDGNLTLTIAEVDLIPPEKPIAIPSTTEITNKDVTVSVTYSADSIVKQYKIGENGEWVDYTRSFAVRNNDTIYFRAEDAAGNESTSSLAVTNIDKVAPTLELTADITTPTNGNVVLTATVSDGTVEYFADGKWNTGDSLTVSTNGTYQFRVTDVAGNVTSKSFEVTNIDKVAPTLELTADITTPTNGNVVLTATVSDGTVEYFADGKWNTGDSLTVSTNGTYQFRVTDVAGNVTSKSFEVTNIDKVAPTLTISGNPTSWTNLDVMLSASSNEEVTFQYSFDNFEWHSGAQVTLSANSSVYFKATDKAGNVTTQSVDVTKIDKVLPDLTVTGNPENWTNKDVTLSAASNEGDTIIEYSFDGKAWYSGSEVTVSENETIHFRATDKAGNVTTQSVDVNKIDKTLPGLTVTGNPENWTNQDVTLAAASNEDDTLIEYSFDGTRWEKGSTVVVTENRNVYFKATDKAGNVTTQKVDVTKIDKVLPALTVTGNAENWTSKDVTLNAASSEEGISFEYSFDGEIWHAGSSVTVKENGTLHFRATDKAGNVTTQRVDVTKIDKILPGLTVTGNPENWTNTNVVLNAASNEGDTLIEYSFDNTLWHTNSSVTVKENGTVYFKATDKAGNVTTQKVDVNKIDKTLPDLTISGNTENWTNKDVTLNAASSEAEVVFEYSFDGKSWFSGSSVTVKENGTLHFRATDKGGNVITQSVDVTKIDKVLPDLTVTGNAENWTNQDVTLNAASNEEDTLIEYSFDGKAWYVGSEVTAAENKTIHFRATDKAGNVTTQSVDVNKIDKTAPSLTFWGNPLQWTNKNVILSASSNEEGVVEYSFDGKAWYTGSAVVVQENRSIYFRTTDKAGNVTTQSVDVTKIDKTAPGAPAQFTVSTGRDSVFINWEDVSDGKGSGVKSFQFRYGKSSELSGEGLSCSASEIRLADLTGGTWYYQVRTRDKAGNSSDWSELRSFTLTGNAPQMLTGSAAGVSWQEMPGTGRYIVEYSTDNFNSAASFTTDAAGVDTFALPEAPYLWRVRSANSQEWAYGEEISGVPAAAPEKVISDNDGMADLFFARSTEQWSTAYEACHFGNALWGGTLEKVSLAGKNRIADLFEGSADANVLLLTDDEEGDALFVDDIYTALGDQARFSQIHEIRSGAGDDIVDMTSQRYDYEGSGVKISGGSGNDTIWASRGNNILFGDEGDDRLIGGKDNDLLSGGSGNDRMHGGGGEDIFTFGGDWGNDSVEQLAGGSVTLWFEEGSESNWNADTLTYTDGANSVTVKGAVSVTLKFGADAELPEGAFSTSVSRKIFEELSFQA